MEARRAYDRIGRLQDVDAFYSNALARRLAQVGEFQWARSVFELGCGTGRFASRLLRAHLGNDARYRAVDVSPKMVSIARKRLIGWSPRAEVVLIEPPGRVLVGTDGQFDRFVACYVLDVLADPLARTVLAEANRLLAPDGLLCLVSLSPGVDRAGRVVSDGWGAISERFPGFLGGRRPIKLTSLLEPGIWQIELHELLTRRWITSELVVAASAANPMTSDRPS